MPAQREVTAPDLEGWLTRVLWRPLAIAEETVLVAMMVEHAPPGICALSSWRARAWEAWTVDRAEAILSLGLSVQVGRAMARYDAAKLAPALLVLETRTLRTRAVADALVALASYSAALETLSDLPRL